MLLALNIKKVNDNSMPLALKLKKLMPIALKLSHVVGHKNVLHNALRYALIYE
jgi:hypothetical protein